MAPYVGQNIGAGKKERVSDGLKKASVCGFIWSVIMLFQSCCSLESR